MIEEKKLSRFLPLIEKVSPEIVPAWGIMTPQNMIEHITEALYLSIGKLESALMVSEREAAIMKRRLLNSPNTFPKNFENPLIKKHAPQKHPTIQLAIKDCQSALVLYYDFFEANPLLKTIHPFLGEIGFEEWETFHIKHFSHHLTQFGIT